MSSMFARFRTPTAESELKELRDEYEALAHAASTRVERMKNYRDEQDRVRDPHMEVYTQDLTDYGHRRREDGQPKKHSIALPLGKALTVKHAYRIAGQLPDVIVDQRDNTAQERYRSQTMEKIVWGITRASKGETVYSSASWNASEVGAGCLDIYWDFGLNMPRIRSVDPAGIFEVQGVDDPHEFQRIYRVWESPLASVKAEYRDKQFRGAAVDVDLLQETHKNGSVSMVKIVQLCDQEKLIRFACSGGNGVVGLYELQHNYGFVPYVVIPNIGPYEDVWGWADYEFVRALCEYIPMLLSREADVLKSVAHGAYIEKNTGQSSTEVRKVIGEGGVLPSKRDGSLDPIQAPEMPAFAEQHRDQLQDLFRMLGFAPGAAWGDPGSGSGTDRGLQLQPLLEYTAMKQLNWQAGLGRLYSMGFRMIEKNTNGKAVYRGSIQGKGGRRTPFVASLLPGGDAIQEIGGMGAEGFPEVIELPTDPKQLFDGDYEVRFLWRNRVDPEDPAYVMSELNKFQQGAQSLETTLTNLGVQDPEGEMRKIEKEAERFPWINQGLVTLLRNQFSGNAQGAGGGAPPDVLGSLGGAMETMGSMGGGGQSGALNADAGAAALGPSGSGQLWGSA